MKFKTLLLGLLPFLLLSCNNHDFEETGPSDNTVFIYMVGDNNLNGFAAADTTDIKNGYKNSKNKDKNNLLIYLDNYSNPVLMQLKMSNNSVVCEIIKKYSEMDSCDADTLKNVINYVESNFEAYHYGLVLWSHGSGSKPASLAHVKSFGWDQDNNQNSSDNATTMDIPDLKTSLLSSGVYFDYILFDACEMQAIEVDYELRNCTDYIIASPWDISTDGGPYDKIIPHCFSSDANLNIPFSIADDFYDYYEAKGDSDVGVMISVVKTDELEDLAEKTKEIITKYLSGESINTSDVFYYDNNYKNYFYDFKSFIISLIKNIDSDYEKNEDYRAWLVAYNEAVPIYLKTDNYIIVSLWSQIPKSSKESNGISTYIFSNQTFPDTYDENWKIYEWYTAAGWKEAGY